MALYAEMFLNSSDNNVTSGTLSDIAAITMGQSPSGSSYNEDGVGEVFYQGLPLNVVLLPRKETRQ